MQETQNVSLLSFSGSQWFRWEPHIHAPGTIMNDQYSSQDAIEEFLNAIETSNPRIRALGITDYYSLDSYEKIVAHKKAGRLPDVELIFPNVEFRFNTGVASGSAINGHLLISTGDPNHLSEAKRFLTNLTFSVNTETYRCTLDDIIKLGKFHNPSVPNDRKALEAGANQFKIEPKELITEIKKSEWARKNILLAVAVGSNDGTAGLQSDSSFAALRKMIERSAQLIFSGQPKQREFWLGKGVDSPEQIIATFKNLKPCIHGSDAHSIDKVGKPALNRYTWIKGDLTFDSLVQICIEPETRVIVGEAPPENGLPSNIITAIEVKDTDWFIPARLSFNSGLVAIIGARGSGKTALADLIAWGCYAAPTQINNNTSFLRRAENFLNDVVPAIHWQTGATSNHPVNGSNNDFDWDAEYVSPKVQYLSQQFVDTLCSAEGMTDELMTEIERVIFSAHPNDERLGIDNFQELLSVKSATARGKRENYEQQLAVISKNLTIERNKRTGLPSIEAKVKEKMTIIQTDKKSREGLIAKGSNDNIIKLEKVTVALGKVSLKIEQLQKRQRGLSALQLVTNSAKLSAFPEYWNKLKTNHSDTSLQASQWDKFKITFVGDVDALIQAELTSLSPVIANYAGTKVATPDYKIEQSFLVAGKELESHTYQQLFHEVERLKYLIGVDNEKGKQYTKLSEKILKEEAELLRLQRELQEAQQADGKIAQLTEQRQSSYEEVFNSIIEEESILKSLYEPLKENLQTQTGSIAKLTFEVERKLDIQQWAELGDSLLDLRKNGPFKGKGSLLDAAKTDLADAWQTGTAEQIAQAMANFRQKHDNNILNHSPFDRRDVAAFNDWGNKISEWLYSTAHITLSYSVKYDGLDISRLSPGTRGIVLLLLYLVIDKDDNRPLIIDQPEENLDPKSIFHELVPLFRAVKLRRQIIIVTHNANLVVNTDADQIIIAECGPHRIDNLPKITYKGGGLENAEIREHVCDILEGGKAAFFERARRLRLHFEL